MQVFAEVLRWICVPCGSRFYCGLAVSLVAGVEVAAGDELEAGMGAAFAGGVCEVGTAEFDLGRSGTVVIALSGFSR